MSCWLEGIEDGFWFMSHHPCAEGGLGGEGSTTAERATRGGSMMGKPPISQMLTIGRSEGEETRPP